MCLKTSWAGLICYTHQYCGCQWLPNSDWSSSRRSAWGRARWLWRERLWEKEGFKMRVENAIRKFSWLRKN